MVESYSLDNGASVYLVPVDGASSLTTLVMYPVGSRYESEKLAGVSHYIEHLMFKGTKKRKNTLALTREIDRLGAQYNAFTGKEYTGYYIKTSEAYTGVSHDILSDMLLNSVFDPKEMEREKGPIIEELKMYKDNPIMDIDNVFEDLLFAGCPLGRDIGGTPKHVTNYKRPDVIAYKERYYSTQNMHIVVAGAINENTKHSIETYFGRGKKAQKQPNKRYKPATVGSNKKEDRLVVHYKKTDQAQIYVGFPGFPVGDKRNYAVSVMNAILGGSMSSRLFIRIRERLGLAYTVRSGSSNFRDAGYQYIQAGLDPKNINTFIKEIWKEIDKLLEKGPSVRELADAKTHIRGGTDLYMEDSSALANWYAKEALFHDNMISPEEYLSKIDAVTMAQVRRVTKQLFKKNQMRIAIIGDVQKEDISY